MWWPTAVFAALLSLQAANPAADGMKALDEQRWSDAAAAFTKAVEADPRDYSHHFHLALALSKLGTDAEAITAYGKVLALKPELPQAELNLGLVLIRQKRAAEAVPHLEIAVKAKPADLRPNLYLGEALLESGDAAKAEPYFLKALEADPKSAAAEYGLGRALLKQGKLDAAAPRLIKAAELDPALTDAQLVLAALYEQQKRLPEAIEVYKRFPNEPAAKERLGELLLESGKAADAIPQLEEAVAKSPTTANRYALATAYILAKQPEKAVPLLEQAVAAEPENIDLRMMYARALREQKKYGAAANEFFRVTKVKPDYAQAWSDLAGMLILSENYPEALAALDRVRALNAETAAHHYFRALVLDKFRQYKPALESYEKFLAMSEGRNPDEEFKARQRIRVIGKELSRR